ncbi:hypothetical protein NQZ68_017532 [Dissostichus eleginoides]|nr:hypothetical protein NQZ68_017532 [Dissostichus eleginoides]
MSLGAERRMETRLKKLEDMIREPRSAINLESLLGPPFPMYLGSSGLNTPRIRKADSEESAASVK